MFTCIATIKYLLLSIFSSFKTNLIFMHIAVGLSVDVCVCGGGEAGGGVTHLCCL